MDSQTSFPFQTQEDDPRGMAVEDEEGEAALEGEVEGGQAEMEEGVAYAKAEGGEEGEGYDAAEEAGEEEGGGGEGGEDDEVLFVGSVPGTLEEGGEYQEEGGEEAYEEEGEEEEYEEDEEEDAEARGQELAQEADGLLNQFAETLITTATQSGSAMWDTTSIGRLLALIAKTRGWQQHVSHFFHFLRQVQLPVLDVFFFKALNEQIIWLGGKDVIAFVAESVDGQALATLLVDLVKEEAIDLMDAGAIDTMVRVSMTHKDLGPANGGLELLKNVVLVAPEDQGERRSLLVGIHRAITAEDKERFCQMLPSARAIFNDVGKVVSIDSDDETGEAGAPAASEAGDQQTETGEGDVEAVEEGYVEATGNVGLQDEHAEAEEVTGEYEGGEGEDIGGEGGEEVEGEYVGEEGGEAQEGEEMLPTEGEYVEGMLPEMDETSNGMTRKWGEDGGEVQGEEGSAGNGDGDDEPMAKRSRLSEEAGEAEGEALERHDSTGKYYS